MNADPECLRELFLCQADEAAQRGYIAWLEFASNDALSLRSREGSTQFLSS
ncbi:MAG TPA: hypothetical protein VNW92_08835 [Polyangiaceae bacterium]|nr:hypothetical protein [Polyangiaceae bacterium]